MPQIGFSNVGSISKTGGFLSKIKWGSILSNTQKTLNVVNQAIPLYKEVKPMINNFRALGRIKNEFTKINNEMIKEEGINKSAVNPVNNHSIASESVPSPTFFL
jgi:hypothetical protein